MMRQSNRFMVCVDFNASNVRANSKRRKIGWGLDAGKIMVSSFLTLTLEPSVGI